MSVEEEVDEACKKYWLNWHSDGDYMPEFPNPSFIYGFKSCLAWLKEKGLITLDIPSNAPINNVKHKGSVVMPKALTAENGSKAAMMGKFFETIEHECEACADWEFSDGCEVCGGGGFIIQKVPVAWTTIKDIYAEASKFLAE